MLMPFKDYSGECPEHLKPVVGILIGILYENELSYNQGVQALIIAQDVLGDVAKIQS